MRIIDSTGTPREIELPADVEAALLADAAACAFFAEHGAVCFARRGAPIYPPLALGRDGRDALVLARRLNAAFRIRPTVAQLIVRDCRAEAPAVRRPAGDAPRKRRCLGGCGRTFVSTGFANRVCDDCKDTAAWRDDTPFAPTAA